MLVATPARRLETALEPAKGEDRPARLSGLAGAAISAFCPVASDTRHILAPIDASVSGALVPYSIGSARVPPDLWPGIIVKPL